MRDRAPTKPRKGVAYVPELDILARDAFPTAYDLADPQKANEANRRRDIARDLIIGWYCDAERQGAVQQLDPRIRDAAESMRQLNGGAFPQRKGGRPDEAQRRLLICQKVQARINAGEGLVEAMKQVAATESPPLTDTAIRDIWYAPSPEWKRWKRLAIAEWALRTGETPRPADASGRKRRPKG